MTLLGYPNRTSNSNYCSGRILSVSYHRRQVINRIPPGCSSAGFQYERTA